MWRYISSTVARKSRYGQCLQSWCKRSLTSGIVDKLPLTAGNYKGLIMQIHVL